MSGQKAYQEFTMVGEPAFVIDLERVESWATTESGGVLIVMHSGYLHRFDMPLATFSSLIADKLKGKKGWGQS